MFRKMRACFSFPRFKRLWMRAVSPNSRVKKPQIQVIPHDDTYLSPARVAWHTTGANMRPRKIHGFGMKMGCANFEGSANLRRIRSGLAGLQKTQNTPKSKMTNPYYFPVLFFIFSFYPNVHQNAFFHVRKSGVCSWNHSRKHVCFFFHFC